MNIAIFSRYNFMYYKLFLLPINSLVIPDLVNESKIGKLTISFSNNL